MICHFRSRYSGSPSIHTMQTHPLSQQHPRKFEKIKKKYYFMHKQTLNILSIITASVLLFNNWFMNISKWIECACVRFLIKVKQHKSVLCVRARVWKMMWNSSIIVHLNTCAVYALYTHIYLAIFLCER